jgi:hypothetical protein
LVEEYVIDKELPEFNLHYVEGSSSEQEDDDVSNGHYI